MTTVKKEKRYIWIIKILILTLVLTFLFSLLSETVLPKINIIWELLLLLVFIIIGIIFDMIGVAITAADTEPFHAMSAKKIKAGRVGTNLIKNASKVSSICNDVVGDICGIISGSVGIYISNVIANNYGSHLLYTTLVVTSVIAGLTIGGKALGKNIAMKEANSIIKRVSEVVSIFN